MQSTSPDEQPLECVAFMAVRGGSVLVERRSRAKRLLPGVVAIPGGHMEGHETAEAAVRREFREELGAEPLAVAYVCTLLHRAEEFRKLHYFVVTRWAGEFSPREADAVGWVGLDDAAAFDLDVDRVAVAEYVRVYGYGGAGYGSAG